LDEFLLGGASMEEGDFNAKISEIQSRVNEIESKVMGSSTKTEEQKRQI
jgi:hypothetical protein